MKVIITRFKEINDGTIGKFQVLEGSTVLMSCFCLEPAGPDTTESGKDRRIPKGNYKIVEHDSQRYQRKLPLIYNENVPKSRAILIHGGNFPKDTLGCVLLGETYNNQGVLNSQPMLKKFLSIVKYPCDLEIINQF